MYNNSDPHFLHAMELAIRESQKQNEQNTRLRGTPVVRRILGSKHRPVVVSNTSPPRSSSLSPNTILLGILGSRHSPVLLNTPPLSPRYYTNLNAKTLAEIAKRYKKVLSPQKQKQPRVSSPQKSQAPNNSSSSANRSSPNRSSPNSKKKSNYTLVHTNPDGNCFFHAIARGVYNTLYNDRNFSNINNTNFHFQLRTAAIEALPALLRSFGTNFNTAVTTNLYNPQKRPSDIPVRTYNHYVRIMKQRCTYVDGPILQAMANVLRKDYKINGFKVFRVFRNNHGRTNVYEEISDFTINTRYKYPPIILHWTGNHYELLLRNKK